MPSYVRKDGTRFALGDHTPAEWAAIRASRLRALNEDVVKRGGEAISEEYIRKLVRSYEEATPA